MVCWYAGVHVRILAFQDFLSSSLLARMLHIAEPQVRTADAYVAWCIAAWLSVLPQYLRLLGSLSM